MKPLTYVDDDQKFVELPALDAEKILNHERTGVSIEHDGETITDPDPKSVDISRPRVVRSGEVTLIKFHASIAVPTVPETD